MTAALKSRIERLEKRTTIPGVAVGTNAFWRVSPRSNLKQLRLNGAFQSQCQSRCPGG
jgi:hypothetical protein